MTQARIDSFLQKEVKEGVYPSTIEAEKDVIKTLIGRDIERGIARGREDIKQGRYKILDDNYISSFLKELTKEILPNNN